MQLKIMLEMALKPPVFYIPSVVKQAPRAGFFSNCSYNGGCHLMWILLQGQFLMENMIDRERTYEFQVELLVSKSMVYSFLTVYYFVDSIFILKCIISLQKEIKNTAKKNTFLVLALT